MAEYDYDLFVIGAGSGGVRAARVAAGFGAKVAIAEEFRYGGTCVIRGCVPKKLFVFASRFAEQFEVAQSYGWQIDNATFSWTTLMANKDAEILRLENIYQTLLDGAGVTHVRDRAEIVDAHTIVLKGENKQITTKYILVATGAAPFSPPIEGIEHTISSNEALHLETLPDSILVVGGGYIAVEFAGIFNGLGVATTLNYRSEQILRGFDEDVRNGLNQEMTSKGVRFILKDAPTKIEKTDGGLRVHFKEGDPQTFGAVMYATGRLPNSAGLGLENVGIEPDRKGAIPVDDYSKTSVDNIYAVGDVTNRANLTPIAIREGQAFAQTLFNDQPTTVDYSKIPTAVFSEPEVGIVGMSEAEAVEAHSLVNVYISRFRPMMNTLTASTEKMMFKLITDGKSDKVLGVHIIGPGAGEMIQLIGVAVTMDATKADLDATIAVHPTASEELVTLKAPTYVLENGQKLG